jgi:hypothetical protein
MTGWNSNRLSSHNDLGGHLKPKQFIGVLLGFRERDNYQPARIEYHYEGEDDFPESIEGRALIEQRKSERA